MRNLVAALALLTACLLLTGPSAHSAITATTTELSFTGNASSSTAYALTGLRYDDSSWITAIQIDATGARTTLTAGTHYTLGGTGTTGAGTLTSTTGNAIPATDTLLIQRNTPHTQTVDLENNVPLNHESLETSLDKATMAIQDLDREATDNLARTVRVPDDETLTELAAAATRAGKVLYFDPTTGAISLTTPAGILALSGGAPSGTGIPSGGTTAQALTKASATDGDVQWTTINAAAITDSTTIGQTLLTTTDQESARDDLGLTAHILTPHTFHKFTEALGELDNPDSGTEYIGIAHKGDSMSPIPRLIGRELQTRHGLGGFPSPNLGAYINGLNWTFGGGAYHAGQTSGGVGELTRSDSESYEYFSTPHQIIMPAAATAELTLDVSAASATSSNNLATANYFPSLMNAPIARGVERVTFIYLKEPGGGTLTFDLDQTGETYTPVNADTDDTLALATVEFTVANPYADLTVQVSNATAESLFVGCIFWKGPGLIYWESSVGGTSMDLWDDSYESGDLSQLDQDLFDLFNTKLIISLQRADDAATPATAFPAYLDAIASYTPASHLVLGEPPYGVGTISGLKSLNQLLRDECVTRALPYIDLLQIAGNDNTIATALGWLDGDNIHLDPNGHRTLAGAVMRHLDHAYTVQSRHSKPVHVSDLYNTHLRLSHLLDLPGCDINFRSYSTWLGATTTGSTFAATFDDDEGLKLDGGTTTGTVAGRAAALMTDNTGIPFNSSSLSASFISYRGIDLVSNVRAYMSLGGLNGTVTDPTDMTGRGAGVEMAIGDDISLTSGVEYARIYYHDGDSVNYSNWVEIRPFGTSSPASEVTQMMLVWDLRHRPAQFINGGVNTTTDTITMQLTGHRLQTGDPVRLGVTSGTISTDLAVETTYYAIRTSSTALQLATTEANALAGTEIDLTDAGSGVFQIVRAEGNYLELWSGFIADSTVAPRIRFAAPDLALAKGTSHWLNFSLAASNTPAAASKLYVKRAAVKLIHTPDNAPFPYGIR